MNKIAYEIKDLSKVDGNHYPLTAKTDRGARMQARRLAKANGIGKYTILFFRPSDGCHGSIDL